jgi:hypothetical protein
VQGRSTDFERTPSWGFPPSGITKRVIPCATAACLLIVDDWIVRKTELDVPAFYKCNVALL